MAKVLPWGERRVARAAPGRAAELLRGLGSMVKLAWQAQPLCFAGLAAAQVLQSLLQPAGMWLLALLVDQLAGVAHAGAGAPALFWPLLGLLVGVTALGRLLAPLQSYLNAELQRRLLAYVQLSIYRKINQFAGLAPFESPSFHDTIQVAAQGAQHGPAQALSLLTQLVGGLLGVLSYLGLLLLLSPLLTLCLLLTIIPMTIAQLRLSRQRFDVVFDNSPRQRQASYHGMLLSGTGYAKELRLFDLAEHFLGSLRSSYERMHETQRRQQLGELRWQALLQLLTSLAAGGALVLVALRALDGLVSLGEVAFYAAAITQVQMALAMIVFALASLNESLLFQRRYGELMAMPDPLERAGEPAAVPQLRHGIELRDVSFRYSAEHPWVLRHVSLFIPAGACVALVGFNGAGKTTLVKLLGRYYDPSEGQILWDGIDIRRFEPAELRRRISATFQDFIRYELSAHENIGLGDVRQLGRGEAVRQAALRAGAHQVVAELPRGYETVLSRWLCEEGQGVELSGGQWQKLALARMFMRDPALLILDEPTAALDAQSEYELHQCFAELIGGRTTILISHRFSAVRQAELIAVLEDGQISEAGSHADLLARGGTYARLYAVQSGYYS